MWKKTDTSTLLSGEQKVQESRQRREGTMRVVLKPGNKKNYKIIST